MTTEKKLRARTVKSFAVLVIFAFFVVGSFISLSPRIEDEESISPVFRHILEFNGSLWLSLFQREKIQTFKAPAMGKRPRVNGDIGLKTPLSLADWSLEINPNADQPTSRSFRIRMEDIRKLPRVDSTAEFRCIEGWSEIISYSGVRFSDFLQYYKLGSLQAQAWEDGKLPSDRFTDVGLETPDGEYYVSLDMESMLHPQTILAFEMNGQPLSELNGAPLRLIIPVKYGIKSLKRIGKIFFSNQRPADYWAEQGYDWFSGL